MELMLGKTRKLLQLMLLRILLERRKASQPVVWQLMLPGGGRRVQSVAHVYGPQISAVSAPHRNDLEYSAAWNAYLRHQIQNAAR